MINNYLDQEDIIMKYNFIKTTLFSTLCAITLMSSATTAMAGKNTTYTSTTKNTSNITVKDVEYDFDYNDQGFEVDLDTLVNWKSDASVTIRDGKDTKYKAYITEKDSDDFEIYVPKLKVGKTYTIKVKGIKSIDSNKYGTLIIKARIPKSATKCIVEDVDYDYDDKELSIDFKGNVTYHSPKVTITNESGTKTFSSKIIERDNDECTIYVSGLKVGSTYRFKLTGVKAEGATKTTTVEGTFTVGYDN